MSGARAWRCRACGAALGVDHGDHVEISAGGTTYRVRGQVATFCPTCGTGNHFSCGGDR
jgi:rubredoxin